MDVLMNILYLLLGGCAGLLIGYLAAHLEDR